MKFTNIACVERTVFEHVYVEGWVLDLWDEMFGQMEDQIEDLIIPINHKISRMLQNEIH